MANGFNGLEFFTVTVKCHFSPKGVFWLIAVCIMHLPLFSLSFASHFFLLAAQGTNSWLHMITSPVFSIVAGLIANMPFFICNIVNRLICDRILENHPYGRIQHIKYLAPKTSL